LPLLEGVSRSAEVLAKYRSARHVGRHKARSPSASAAQASGLEGVRSRSDAVAVDMGSFFGRDEGEVSDRGREVMGCGKTMTEGRAGFDSSHQPSFRSRRGSRDLLN
jgi:hypothetical protein